MTTGMLLISHVPKIAAGVAELIRQVAPDINLTTAAGPVRGKLGPIWIIFWQPSMRTRPMN